MHSLYVWLENSWWAKLIANSGVASALVEVTHYFSIFLLVGSTAIVDLRLLGVAGQRETATELAERLFPTAWAGLGGAVLTGFIMFAGSARGYYNNGWFNFKLLVVLVAAIFGLVVQRSVRKWDQLPATPTWGRFVALVSIALWIAAILVGVEVPALTGVG
jgi:hypothetical protein